MAEVDFERLGKTWELLDETKNTVHSILHTAMADGELDKDEIDMLNTISKTIDGYSELLEKVLEDNQVTDSELVMIKNYEKEIMNTVENQARSDGLFSIEEEEMIETLQKCLSGFGELGVIKNQE